jgi:hypothetical protein
LLAVHVGVDFQRDWKCADNSKNCKLRHRQLENDRWIAQPGRVRGREYMLLLERAGMEKPAKFSFADETRNARTTDNIQFGKAFPGAILTHLPDRLFYEG